MFSKLSLSIFSFFFLSLQLYSQGLNLEWGFGIGSKLDETPISIMADKQGNIISSGQFSGTVDFDPDPNNSSITALGSNDIYIQKLTNSGSLVWAKSIGGVSAFINEKACTIDSDGNILIVGWFNGTVDFDPDLNTIFNLTSNTNIANIFILKLNQNGDFLWVNNLGTSQCSAYSVQCDNSNRIYIGGQFTSTIDMNPGPNTNTLISNGSNDVFILKLDDLGQYVWAKQIGGASNSNMYGMTIDSEANIYCTGYFSGTIDIDPGTNPNNYTSNGGLDCYVVKLDSSGNYKWGHQIGAASTDYGNSINIDNNENIYIVGEFTNTVDFDPGTGNTNTTPSTSTNTFLLKYNKFGQFIWVKQYEASFSNPNQQIDFDGNNNIYLTGNFSATSIFDPSVSSISLTSNGAKDVFLSKISSTGNLIWVKSFGGQGNDIGSAITVSIYDEIFITGIYRGVLDINPNNSILNTVSYGLNDAFTAKFIQCQHSNSLIDISICNENQFISPSGKIWMTSAQYSDTIDNHFGCDSIIVFNLTFKTIDSTIYLEDGKIIANQSGATYQWFDCNLNLPILNEVSQSFKPTKNGLYRVEVSNGNCSINSICVAIVNVGLYQEFNNNLKVYPNPSNIDDKIILEFKDTPENTYYSINDNLGRTIITNQLITSRKTELKKMFSSGAYTIKIDSEKNSRTYKLIIQ